VGRCTRPALLEDTESRDVGGEIGDGIDVVGEIDQDGVEDQMAQTYVWMPLAAPTQK